MHFPLRVFDEFSVSCAECPLKVEIKSTGITFFTVNLELQLVSIAFGATKSGRKCSIKKLSAFLINFTKVTGKHLRWSLFLMKQQVWRLQPC